MASNSTLFEAGLDVFGPQAPSPNQFDFSPLFEYTILSILPSALLLVLIPFRLWSLYGQSHKVSRSFLQSNKLFLLVVFTSLQAAVLILYATNSGVRTPTSLAATALVLADALGLCWLSHIEHVRSIQPSSLINTYLMVTLLFDIAHTRTLWVQGAPQHIAAVFTVTLAVKLALTIIEAIEKRNILLGPYRDVHPEVTSGIYSRALFWWLNALLTIGFRRIIHTDDLFPIEEEMKSTVLRRRAEQKWAKANKSRSHALFWSTLNVTRRQLLLCVFPRLCLIAFRYTQPFLLSRTTHFVTSHTDAKSIGWGLTGAFCIVFLGIVIANGVYTHMTFRFTTVVRGTLISNYIGKAQKRWNEGIQTRIDVTTTILGSMKAVKMLGFTPIVFETVQNLRVTELKMSTLFSLLSASVFFTNNMRVLAPFVTFLVFALIQDYEKLNFTSATAFTGLSLVGMLSNPVNTMLRTIPTLKAALACFDRIEKFLESPSRKLIFIPLEESLEASDKGGKTTEQDITLSQDSNEENMPTVKLSSRQPHHPSPTLIKVQNAGFAWTADTPIITDVSFSVARKGFVFIIGPVGCGKSTLLKGLMSETPFSQGTVHHDSRISAFADQKPWIQNTTIRQNIIGPSLLNAAWYEEVVVACALDHDVAMMPDSHDTIVGSGGISLSGGQKQRVALARMMYAKSELMIIDDGFSGLDPETEEIVFTRLFGKSGLFRQLQTTVLLVTNAVNRLPYADHIIALDATGGITEQGSLDQLRGAGGYVEGLETRHKYESISDRTGIYAKEISIESPSSGAEQKKNAEQDELNRPIGEWSTYKYYFASIGWPRALLSLFLVSFSGVAVKLTELVVSLWTKAYATSGDEVNPLYLGLYGMIAGIGAIFWNVSVYHFFLYVVPGSAEKLHAGLLKSVMDAPLSFFTSTDTGVTTNRFSQDMSIVDKELPFTLIDLVVSMIQTIMGAILMCIATGYFAFALPPVVAIVWVIQKFYLRTSRQVRLLDLEAKSPLYTQFIESLSGLVTIRAFGWSEDLIDQNLRALDNSQQAYYLLFCIQRWLSIVLDVMVAVLAILLMVLIVELRQSVGAEYARLALLNIMSFSASLTWIVRQWTALETSIGAVSRLKAFTSTTPTENLEDERQSVPENWPDRGGIVLKGVSASYSVAGVPILKDINMDIKPGEKIGVCGRTGSGKSSLIMTLLRLLEVSPESSILIDGVDLTKIPRQTVRVGINAIPQDAFIMKGTIRLNASPLQKHGDAEIIDALSKVRLWSLIESKGGLGVDLDTEFSSPGQKQLFCLARALLRKGKIVVMDEVSSSIDLATDKVIQEVIRQEFEGATIISIAHRLDSILNFDRIAVLSDGQLVEFDNPQVLLNRPTAFRDLYNL
ncbi:hypothetical protein PENSOL_c006G04539 [Penicillium solitum]|uniref:ABC transporter n=1 Tax=Penicillium solitum TaxID=60172 RepID=A0A1V6RDE1_9EURO|nr:uncharacterized protein PENSOL_c006G04539 [Penicillium solitum]OQD99550.1 hypothetical protein PENSOL_c006G04539 [Penicillium solitum]